MKKIKKMLLMLIIFLSIFTLTGCGKEEVPVDMPEPLPDNVSKEDLDITYSTRTVANEVVFFLKNKGPVDAHDIKIEVEFWQNAPEVDNEEDEDDGFSMEGTSQNKTPKGEDIYIGSTKLTFDYIKQGYSIAGMASAGSKKYDYYKIFIDIDPESKGTEKKVFAYNDLIVEDNTVLEVTEEEMAEGKSPSTSVELIVKNKGEYRISFIEIAVAYYKDNELIGYSMKRKANLDPMTKGPMSISFPVGKSYSDHLKFDSYRIFINNVYRSKY